MENGQVGRRAAECVRLYISWAEVLKEREMLYPTVRAREYSDGRWQFIITTDETILHITEAEAKRLFKQLEIAFRPTKRPLDGAKAPRKSKRSASTPRK